MRGCVIGAGWIPSGCHSRISRKGAKVAKNPLLLASAFSYHRAGDDRFDPPLALDCPGRVKGNETYGFFPFGSLSSLFRPQVLRLTSTGRLTDDLVAKHDPGGGLWSCSQSCSTACSFLYTTVSIASSSTATSAACPGPSKWSTSSTTYSASQWLIKSCSAGAPTIIKTGWTPSPATTAFPSSGPRKASAKRTTFSPPCDAWRRPTLSESTSSARAWNRAAPSASPCRSIL